MEKAVLFLNNTNDYATLEVGKALDFLYDAYFKDENAVSEEGAKHGLGKLFLKIWMPLSGHYTPSDVSQAGYNLIRMTEVFWNYSNQCPYIGCDLGKYGAFDIVIASLKKLEEQPDSKWKSNRLL